MRALESWRLRQLDPHEHLLDVDPRIAAEDMMVPRLCLKLEVPNALGGEADRVALDPVDLVPRRAQVRHLLVPAHTHERSGNSMSAARTSPWLG